MSSIQTILIPRKNEQKVKRWHRPETAAENFPEVKDGPGTQHLDENTRAPRHSFIKRQGKEEILKIFREKNLSTSHRMEAH